MSVQSMFSRRSPIVRLDKPQEGMGSVIVPRGGMRRMVGINQSLGISTSSQLQGPYSSTSPQESQEVKLHQRLARDQMLEIDSCVGTDLFSGPACDIDETVAWNSESSFPLEAQADLSSAVTPLCTPVNLGAFPEDQLEDLEMMTDDEAERWVQDAKTKEHIVKECSELHSQSMSMLFRLLNRKNYKLQTQICNLICCISHTNRQFSVTIIESPHYLHSIASIILNGNSVQSRTGAVNALRSCVVDSCVASIMADDKVVMDALQVLVLDDFRELRSKAVSLITRLSFSAHGSAVLKKRNVDKNVLLPVLNRKETESLDPSNLTYSLTRLDAFAALVNIDPQHGKLITSSDFSIFNSILDTSIRRQSKDASTCEMHVILLPFSRIAAFLPKGIRKGQVSQVVHSLVSTLSCKLSDVEINLAFECLWKLSQDDASILRNRTLKNNLVRLLEGFSQRPECKDMSQRLLDLIVHNILR